jgi:sugar phosphate isomerase/epimerase
MQLRRDFCFSGLSGLPRSSAAWRESAAERLSLLAAHGYQGVIAWGGWEDIRNAGLIPCGMARICVPRDADDVATRHQCLGLDFTTVHAGTGFETDLEMDALAVAILHASATTGYRLHLETHRATMTQDVRRTLDLLTRFPNLPLTLDFSHWYTGHEMAYGEEFPQRLQRLAPLMRHVRSLQLRFGSTGRIQAPLDPAAPHYQHHIAALDLCFEALSTLDGRFTISCAPELLPARTEDGQWIAYGEESDSNDRFEDALALSRLAENRFRRVFGPQDETVGEKGTPCL